MTEPLGWPRMVLYTICFHSFHYAWGKGLLAHGQYTEGQSSSEHCHSWNKCGRHASCSAQAVLVGDWVSTWVSSPRISCSFKLIRWLPRVCVICSPLVRPSALDRRYLWPRASRQILAPVIPSQQREGWVHPREELRLYYTPHIPLTSINICFISFSLSPIFTASPKHLWFMDLINPSIITICNATTVFHLLGSGVICCPREKSSEVKLKYFHITAIALHMCESLEKCLPLNVLPCLK